MGRGAEKIKWPIHLEVIVHLRLEIVFLIVLFKLTEKSRM